MEWQFRNSTPADAAWIAALRAEVMRPDLERLGRFDPTRVRRRFLDAFSPADTRMIVVAGDPVGCVAVRPDADAVWLEHFYIATAHQGSGLGSSVLDHVLTEHAASTVRLNVLQKSPARRLYERFGFEFDHEDAVDVFLVRTA